LKALVVILMPRRVSRILPIILNWQLKHFELAIDILSDILINPKLETTEIDREKV